MNDDADRSGARARTMWTLFEPIHAVSYFAPHTRVAFEAAGVRGFWRSYFAGRAAPLGRVGPHLVHAAFHSFTLGMVERAIPSVWELVAPDQAWAIRQAAGGDTLGRCLGDLGVDDAAWIADRLQEVTSGLDPIGRPFFASHLDLPSPDTTSAPTSIWTSCTLLREHRGDGYIAAATSHDLDPLELLLLAAAVDATPARHALDNRGWTSDDWNTARERLTSRGLLDAAGQITQRGRQGSAVVEATTDRLAAQAWASVSTSDVDRLSAGLTTIAEQIAVQGWITYPNPVGVPPPTRP